MIIEPVPSSRVNQIWLEVVPWVEKALASGDPDLGSEDVHHALINQNMQLWTARKEGQIKVVVITQIMVNPLTKVGQLLLCAGEEMEEWQEYILVLQTWFKTMGCNRMELPGREGWGRAMAKYGFQPERLIVRKQI